MPPGNYGYFPGNIPACGLKKAVNPLRRFQKGDIRL
jgi:hypothetical protein